MVTLSTVGIILPHIGKRVCKGILFLDCEADEVIKFSNIFDNEV